MVEAKKQDKEVKAEKRQIKKEINQMKQEIEEIRRKQQKMKGIEPFQMCQNTKMLSKLSGSLFSMYNIYFQEISDALIDDLLLDEIDYLNKKDKENPEV